MTYIKWDNRRPYVYNSDGSYNATYRDYRYKRECGNWTLLYARGYRRIKLKEWQRKVLHDIDLEVRRWWLQKGKKKCW